MCPVVFYSACRNRRHLGPRIDRTGAGSWCGVCASSARRPGWRSDVAARKPRRGAPIVDWDRQAPRCFTRRVGHHNRRYRASIIAQNVAASIIKIQYRATARHRLADQIHARSATRHASRYLITDADLCRILGYEQCPQFTYERRPRLAPALLARARCNHGRNVGPTPPLRRNP